MKNHQLLILFWVSLFSFLCLQYPLDELLELFKRHVRVDTIGHFLGFFILAWVIHSLINISLFKTALIITVYAVLSELGQFYLGYRSGEINDTIADITGVLFFILIKKSYIFTQSPTVIDTDTKK